MQGYKRHLWHGFNESFVKRIKCCQNKRGCPCSMEGKGHKGYSRLSRQRDFISLEISKKILICNFPWRLQYRSNVSYHLSSRFSRDASRFSRDESRFLRDASRFARESLKHLVWNILLARSQRAYQRRCHYTHM